MICPNCQQENSETEAFCRVCGRPLVPAVASAPRTPPLVPPMPPPQRVPRPPAPQLPSSLCRVCGLSFPPRALCPRCATPYGTIANPNDPTCATYLHVGYPYPASVGLMESTMADPLRAWNWGAMLLTPFWALANRVWGAFVLFVLQLGAILLTLTLGGIDAETRSGLLLVLLLGFLSLAFSLGARGNVLAWRAGRFSEQEAFLRTQGRWNRAGGITLAILAFAGVLALILSSQAGR